MSIDTQVALTSIAAIPIPGGRTLGEADLIRAFSVDAGTVRFVLELADADQARAFAPVEDEARRILLALPGVDQVSIVRTAQAGEAPPLVKLGRHPQAQDGPRRIPGVARILAVGSGKGGVGKSTVTSNLAIALTRAGRRVGILDADIHGPSQPRMMGASGRPTSTDQRITPLHAHGVTLMSVGFMLKDGESVVWRGPILMGAMQQMLHQVNWGELDVLLVDLPPGTGDVQLTLCQKAALTGAIIVSTPQDVALLDARRAIDMFGKLKTPVLGLIENMSAYICPNCGFEAHPFGHGGVAAEARALDLPFLGEIPLELEVRLAGDAGTPIALGDGPVAQSYARLADRLIGGGMA